VELTEGVHRLTLYYAEANPAAETNASKRLFSVRLHWQPPFAGDFLCVPAQAFPKHLPAAVVRCEGGNNSPQPFIHIESVAQVLCGAHRGEKQARQRVLLVARAVGGIPGTSLQAANAAAGPGEPLTVWAAAGEETKLSLRGANPGAALVTRAVTMPCLDKNDEDLLDLEGELAVKSAPDFIYPDETAHIHLEALLAAPPMLVFKERLEKNLLPPLPRPMGRFRATWRLEEQGAAPDTPVELDATPVEGERRKLRVSLETGKLLEQARRGKTRLTVQLAVGGVEVEEVCLRLLHAAAPWPGTVRAGADHLLFSPEVNQPGDCPGERAMIVVPKQDEADYRTFAPLKAFTRERTASGEGLFLGDPLVESVQPKPNGGELFGLASALAGLTPNMQWKGVCTPGPHRYLPVFRMLADLESFARTRPDGKLPPVVVVCLGAGDVARQTPLHTFQRAVDAVVNRLRLGGARRIVVAGVIPEPARERQCETYQERLSSLLRQHHVDGLDIFNNWTKDDAWERRFLLDGAGSAKLYGPVPNAAAREEIAKLLKDKL
jgi:lysophospholipase L1-like esterase